MSVVDSSISQSYKKGIGRVSKEEAEAILKRLKKELSIKSDRQVCIALGLSSSALSAAKSSGMPPYAAIVTKCIEDGISLDYIFGAKNNRKDDVTQAIDANKTLEVIEKVESILDKVITPKNLTAERVILITKNLRPLLIEAAFKSEFNYLYVQGIAEGALIQK